MISLLLEEDKMQKIIIMVGSVALLILFLEYLAPLMGYNPVPRHPLAHL